MKYDKIVAVAVALYTFYFMISSLYYFIKYRKYKSLIISSAKIINVVTSFISMLSLEMIMLSTFGSETEFNEIMVMSTGSVISVLIFVISLVMILKSY